MAPVLCSLAPDEHWRSQTVPTAPSKVVLGPELAALVVLDPELATALPTEVGHWRSQAAPSGFVLGPELATASLSRYWRFPTVPSEFVLDPELHAVIALYQRLATAPSSGVGHWRFLTVPSEFVLGPELLAEVALDLSLVSEVHISHGLKLILSMDKLLIRILLGVDILTKY